MVITLTLPRQTFLFTDTYQIVIVRRLLVNLYTLFLFVTTSTRCISHTNLSQSQRIGVREVIENGTEAQEHCE